MTTRLVQFEMAGSGRHVGYVDGDRLIDLTARHPHCQRVIDLFEAAQATGISLLQWIDRERQHSPAATFSYAAVWNNDNLQTGPRIVPPVDHADPHRVLVTGTGLTHLGSMQSRDKMHAKLQTEDESQMSDSRKMFLMGLRSGRPAPGTRGVAPEWFYKGNGSILRGHRDPLDVPEFALDGGEEPEIVGCYVIDRAGHPRRLGFTLSNEWSDHATEQINYLYLAPSKLRSCACGPELVLDHDFQQIDLQCQVTRGSQTLYDSGPMLSGEQHMTHTLANLEDHHFKYPQHRQPGDIHLYFFGTSQLSFSTRQWKYESGDVVHIAAPGFSLPLINPIEVDRRQMHPPIVVAPA